MDINFFYGFLSNLFAGVVAGLVLLFGLEKRIESRREERMKPVRLRLVKQLNGRLMEIAKSWGQTLGNFQSEITGFSVDQLAQQMKDFNERNKRLSDELQKMSSGLSSGVGARQDFERPEPPSEPRIQQDTSIGKIMLIDIEIDKRRLEQVVRDIDGASLFFSGAIAGDHRVADSLSQLRRKVVESHEGLRSLLEILTLSTSDEEKVTYLMPQAMSASFAANECDVLISQLWKAIEPDPNVAPPTLYFELVEVSSQQNIVRGYLEGRFPEYFKKWKVENIDKEKL